MRAAIYGYANWQFGPVWKQHEANGGRKGSWWAVVGVSALGLLLVFAVLFAMAILWPALFDI